MPFGVVSGVGRGMGALDGCDDRRREGTVFLGGRGIWASHCNHGAFATRSSQIT